MGLRRRRKLRHRGRELTAAAAAGYLAGTFPSADLATRLATGGETDLRVVGSGNPGAVNARAVLGTKWGMAVLAADVAKGAIGSVAGGYLAGGTGAHVGGTAAVIGHCFPLWSGFRGGKGVATSGGQCLATFPAYASVEMALLLLTSAVPSMQRRSFEATAVGSTVWVVAGVAAWRRGWGNGWGPKPTAALPLSAAVSGAVIISRFLSAREPADRQASRDRPPTPAAFPEAG